MKIYNIIIVLFAVLAFTGCTQRGHDHEHDHNHEHEHTDEHNHVEEGHSHNETLQLTAYSSDFEVFAEATPFVAGQSSEILAHFSFIENFKPLENGSVTASLLIGADSVYQMLEQSLQPGIFKFSLKPVATGEGKLVFNIKTAQKTFQVTVPGIKVYSNEHEAHHAAADMAVTSSNGITFTKEQSWKIDFATADVRKEPFGQIICTTGQIQPSQGDERIITAKTSGIVLFPNNNVVEGKTVNAGQSLFSIDGSSMADNNLSVRYAEAVSEYNRAKTEYERKQELAKDNIVSQSDLLKAKTDLTNTEAVYNNLKRNFSSGQQTVSSPIGGFVTRVLVRNGQYTEAGQPVLIVSQNKDLFIKAEVQPKYFDMLNGITSVNIRVLNNNRAYTLEELGGRMVSYGKSTDIGNPLIPVVFQVNNKAGLLAGSFVEMYIKTQTNAQALTIPNDAIVEEMGNYFVFTQLTPELFEKRAIKKGVTDGIRTEITEGVTATDRVVSKGAVLVKLAQAAGALDAHSGHVH